MKRFLIACLLLCVPILALDGPSEVRVEELYDAFRSQHLSPLSEEEQSKKIMLVQTLIRDALPKLPVPAQEIVRYFNHLLCETHSILTGYMCNDHYTPQGVLTQDARNISLTQLRTLLVEEHSIRRIRRGLGALRVSEKLNTIAQSYAQALCQEKTITHELHGSTLGARYDAGGYDYIAGGENLGLGQRSIAEILDQLTTSIHHRENMYKREYTELGVGYCDDIWVLNYGLPTQP